MAVRRGRCQPVFARPIASSKDRSIAFQRATLLTMLLSIGEVPRLVSSKSTAIELDQLVLEAKRPVAIFPEGTSGNNVGLVEFASTFERLGTQADILCSEVCCAS